MGKRAKKFRPLKTHLNKKQYKGEQKAMGSKISIKDYERVIRQLDATLLEDPCSPYLKIAVKALDKNTKLRINENGFSAANNTPESISQERLKELHKIEKSKKAKKKNARNNDSYKRAREIYKKSVTLADKLAPLPDEITRKTEEIVQDFRIHKKTIKKFFQTATKTNRNIAYKVINSPSQKLSDKQKLYFSTIQLKGLSSVEKARQNAKKKLKNIYNNPISGFKEEAIDIIKNDDIKTSDIEFFLPDSIKSPLRRAFITALITEPKRARALYQNAYKTLPHDMFSTFQKIINQEGEYKDFHFKYIRSYIEKGGTASYIKNSKGLVTDSQKREVEWLLENLSNIQRKIDKTKRKELIPHRT